MTSLLDTIRCNLSETEKESFSEVIKLLNQIPIDIINRDETYFLRMLSDTFYELRLAPIDNKRCELRFDIDLEEDYKNLHWACDGFNPVEERYYYSEDFDFTYLAEFVESILHSKVTADII